MGATPKDIPYGLPHPAKLALLAGSMLALTLAVTLASAAQGVSELATAVTRARQADLAQFVRHDCGSCHGLTLRGGLGPPLTPEALAGKPAAYLKTTILDGRPGTAMPGWRPLLPDAEAAWIAHRLLNGVPDAR